MGAGADWGARYKPYSPVEIGAQGQIRVVVHAVGVYPTDWKLRKGLMGGQLPQTTGREVAGVVDEVGRGVTDVAVGDRVFGFSADGEGAAELALLADRRDQAAQPDEAG